MSVAGAALGVADHSEDIDRDLQLRLPQCLDDEPRRRRIHSGQVFSKHGIDILPRRLIGDEGRDLADVFHPRTRLFQQHLDVLHRLLRLRLSIVGAREPTAVQSQTTLAL